jgi:sulfur-oxidizing protein SoxY
MQPYWRWAHSLAFGMTLALLGGLTGQAVADETWTALRMQLFGEREIHEAGDRVIALEAPDRAQDAAIVPITIRDLLPGDAGQRIRTIWLVIDENPAPLGAVFRFTPESPRADIGTRIRVNAYTNVRAIAETDDGELHMATRFVKASGGCSAPAGKDMDAALARLGNMRLRTSEETDANGARSAHVLISHPNNTGLQIDQLTRLRTPAHFVREIEVSFNGRPVLTAETTISISEDPGLRFYYRPSEEGELTVQAVDTRDQRFQMSLGVTPVATAGN